MEERRGALCPDDCACGVEGAAVVVAGDEMGVVVASLQLQSGFEDFGWHVDNGSRQVSQES